MEVVRTTRSLESTEQASYELTETEAASRGPTLVYTRFSAFSLCLCGTPGCLNEWDSDSCACSWSSFPSIEILGLALMWWFSFYLITLYFVTFGCFLLDPWSFLRTDRKRVLPEGRGSGEKLGVDGGETVIRKYYMIKKIYFNLKTKWERSN